MAGSLNKVTLIGNVGKDPEIKNTQDGREIASFSLATTDAWKDKASGERRERTEWHRVVIFAPPLVGIIKNYIHKGSRIYLEGSLQTRKWNDQAGHERTTTEIVLQNFNSVIIMLDAKSGASGSEFDNSFDLPSKSGFASKKNDSYMADEIDDEIPF